MLEHGQQGLQYEDPCFKTSISYIYRQRLTAFFDKFILFIFCPIHKLKV